MSVTISQGTQTAIRTTTVSGAEVQHVRPEGGTLDLGTVAIPSGTITTIGAGTQNTLGTVGVVNNLAGGTLQLNQTPVQTPLIFGTLGTAGGSFFGTLSAASGAGTKHYISGLSVIGQAGTVDVRILTGTSIQGTGVLGAGNVVPAGGYIRDFTTPFPTGTNSELTYHFVGAGTAFIIVNYWKGA